MLFIKSFLLTLASIPLGFIAGIFLYFTLGGIFIHDFYKPYIVLSGSMEPAVPTGSVVLSRPATYKLGDIITFSENGSKKDLVTHRLTAIQEKEGEIFYKTKGDANEDEDTSLVPNNFVLGKVGPIIPYAGYLVDFAKTPKGFIMLVIIPATIIVYEELKSLKGEIFKGVKHLTKPKKNLVSQSHRYSLEAPKSKTSFGSSYYLFLIIPISGVLFVAAFSASKSFFRDSEKLSGNTLGAAASFAPPSAPPLAPLSLILPDSTPTSEPNATPLPTDIPQESPTPVPSGTPLELPADTPNPTTVP